MCGIIYARAKSKTNVLNPVNKLVLKQFKNQRSRGTDGFGVYDFDYRHIIHEPKEKKMISWMKSHPMAEMMFHHRMPTSTGNVKNACHPFSTKDYFGETQYILIHNGVISNARDMAKVHVEKYGIEYSSVQDDGRFNDSEALLWDVALLLEERQTELKAHGSCAFICLEKHKSDPSKNRLHWFHNAGHTTLYKRDNAKAFMLSSTGGDGASEVPINQHYTYSYETGETSSKYLWLPSAFYSPSQPNTGTVDNHMPYSDDTQTSMFKEEEKKDKTMLQEYEEQEEKQFRLLDDNQGFANKLKAKVREFMSYADGSYSDCLFLLRAELKDAAKKNYSLENWYEMQQLGGAIAIILADPFWDGENPETIHPVFTKDGSHSVDSWDGSSVAAIREPISVLEQTRQVDGAKHIAQVLARQAVRKGWNQSQKHSVPSAPDLITSIPVLP